MQTRSRRGRPLPLGSAGSGGATVSVRLAGESGLWRAPPRTRGARLEVRGVKPRRQSGLCVTHDYALDGAGQPVTTLAYLDECQQDVPVHEHLLVPFVRVRPHRQLDGAAEILDTHRRERLALPRREATHGHHAARDDHLLACEVRCELYCLRGDVRSHVSCRALKRMLGDVRAQELALPEQQLALRRLDGLQLQRRQRRVDLVAEEVEHRGLAGVALSLSLLRHGQHAADAADDRGALDQLIEGARLREGFEYAAVHFAGRHAPREVLDRCEALTGVSLGEQ